MKVQDESGPKVIFDNSAPDYEPLTSIQEENSNKVENVHEKPKRVTAPLATPEKV